VTGGARLCFARSFICGGLNFDANRTKLLRSDQVLQCLQRTLEVNTDRLSPVPCCAEQVLKAERLVVRCREGRCNLAWLAGWGICEEAQSDARALFYSGSVLKADDLDGPLSLVDAIVNQIISVNEFQD